MSEIDCDYKILTIMFGKKMSPLFVLKPQAARSVLSGDLSARPTDSRQADRQFRAGDTGWLAAIIVFNAAYYPVGGTLDRPPRPPSCLPCHARQPPSLPRLPVPFGFRLSKAVAVEGFVHTTLA